jgi:hypothetical protein
VHKGLYFEFKEKEFQGEDTYRVVENSRGKPVQKCTRPTLG